MATKDEQPGLLSKMASFMRGSGKDKAVSVLPEPEKDSVNESAYDKNALKALIERKRHNDLIRKHEFDALRKLRNSSVSAAAGSARPSVFQVSMPSDLDGRADTLKKIDEIEAQMSKQWWKGKQDAAAAKHAAAAPAFVPPPPVPKPRPVAATAQINDKTLPFENLPNSTAVVMDAFKATEAMEVSTTRQLARSQEYLATQLETAMQPLAIDLDFGEVEHSFSIRHTHTPTLTTAPQSPLPAAEGMLEFEFEDMVTDPELEEAAIRYANGDSDGAEFGLLEALAASGLAPNTARAWLAALLDLFRATHKRARFDAVVQQFSVYCKDANPKWYTLSNPPQSWVDPGLSQAIDLPVAVEPDLVTGSDALWECPKELGFQALEVLQHSLATHVAPWRLGWSRLVRIAPDAMPLLGVVLRKFCDEAVQLQFVGAERLIHALSELTPTMESSVAPAWWLVRLNALRVVQLYDDFENVALDYCITYEVSPPAWEPAKCHYENTTGGQMHIAPTPVVAPPVVSAAVTDRPDWVFPPVPVGAIELKGQILGDALSALDGHSHSADDNALPVHPKGETLLVYCSHLERVDFSAAGSILNWAALRQSEGCKVQFREVNRMVAAFFNVIGINEHARVIPPPL